MNKQQEALKLALEALEVLGWQPTEEAMDYRDNAIDAIRNALADSALERMAENAREIGLDYEPAQQQEQIVAWITNGSLYGLRRTNKKTVVVHREKTKVARIPVLIKEDA